MPTLKLSELMADKPAWLEFTQVKKTSQKAFDFHQYWKKHIKSNMDSFNEVSSKIMMDAGATKSFQQLPGGMQMELMQLPDDISDTKRAAVTKDIDELNDKEIKIPLLTVTLRQLSTACKGDINETMLDTLEKYCKEEPKPKKSGKK